MVSFDDNVDEPLSLIRKCEHLPVLQPFPPKQWLGYRQVRDLYCEPAARVC
jgi:hypothetical protein